MLGDSYVFPMTTKLSLGKMMNKERPRKPETYKLPTVLFIIVCILFDVFMPRNGPRPGFVIYNNITALPLLAKIEPTSRPPFPIDLVYTWVDGRDPVWRAEFNRSLVKYNISINQSDSDRRYIDLDELKYSLRSVEKNLNWYNLIYIVTARQKPKWMNIKHPKIRFVYHEAIFPPGVELPSFNSYAIENVIHKIPGLSEHFIYFNDDFFIGRPLPYTYFFTPTGKPVMLYIRRRWIRIEKNVENATKSPLRNDMGGNQFGFVLYYTVWLCERYFKKRQIGYYVHAPTPMTITLNEEVEKIWPDDMNRTRYSRFRHFQNVLIQELLLLYGMGTNKINIVRVNRTINIFYMIANEKKFDMLPYNRLAVNKPVPMTFCINTDNGTMRSQVKSWMDKFWDFRSSYELPDST